MTENGMGSSVAVRAESVARAGLCAKGRSSMVTQLGVFATSWSSTTTGSTSVQSQSQVTVLPLMARILLASGTH